mgnify:CR=1 FL=1
MGIPPISAKAIPPHMAISEFAARNAKPREKVYKIYDGGGLHLLVRPNGSKLWRLKFRFAGKEKVLSFGPYPIVSIAEACRKRDAPKTARLAGPEPGPYHTSTLPATLTRAP